MITATFLALTIFRSVRPEKPIFLPLFRRGLLNFACGRFLIFCQNLVGLDMVFAQSQKSAYMNAYFLGALSRFIWGTFFLFCWFLLSFSSLDSYLTLVGWQKNIFNNFGMHTAHSAHYCCPNPAGKLILVFAPCIFLICTSIDALSFLTSGAIEKSKILGLRKEVA